MLSYEEARLFLEQTSRFGSVLGLTSMKALMEELGNPQDAISVIHIAGTNGKGSVGAYLASIGKAAGLKVGRYCSPAVFDPLECWQYNGRNISPEEYASFLSEVKKAYEKVVCKGIQPTVFELETALAFVYFKAMKVDVLFLETGLGGETDATNVVKHPLACVFTTISRDHMQFLGETLTEIALVKSGIIKAGAYVFSAEQKPEVKLVLDEKATQVNEGYLIDKKNCVTYVDTEALEFVSQRPGQLEFYYKGKKYTTSMAGMYQMQNAALAIEVFEKIFLNLPEMSDFQIPAVCDMLEERGQVEIIAYGVEKAYWPGRFEVIGYHPLCLIDGAHNEDAVKQLAITVEKSFTNQPLDLIIGILADKEHEKMLAYMMPFANRIFTVTPPNQRGLDGKILAEEVKVWHEDVICCESIKEAVEAAISHSTEKGCPILAFGSLSYLGILKENYKQICESRMRDV